MKKILLTLAVLVLLAGVTMADDDNPVVHRASLGSADVCEALGLPTGCDANFSLVAKQWADGSVKGQWQDTWAGGQQGVHVAVDCLNVVGNGAVIGGVVTHGWSGDQDLTGLSALTALVDQGTSANDPPDLLSFSFLGFDFLCTDLSPVDFGLWPLFTGQVKVR